MSGGNKSEIIVTLRNPLDYNDIIQYYIEPLDNPLAKDWISALKLLLKNGNHLEKNFCFLGFPNSARDLDFLCASLNKAIFQINKFNSELFWIKNGLKSYVIEDYFVPETVRFSDDYSIPSRTHHEGSDDYYHIQHIGLTAKKEVLNRLHNHFEILQGTVEHPSQYYLTADYETKYAIRQLNVLCHEIENLILSQFKEKTMPDWIRPSQITTWLNAPRYELTAQHRKLFLENGYDRRFGHVYMHWAQIGKTLFEVFRDEDAPILSNTTCDAITHLKYYSGEFDVEWGLDVVTGKDSRHFWHIEQQKSFNEWLLKNNLDPNDENLSLGYLPIGKIDLLKSFQTTDHVKIWDLLASHLDIYSIQIDDTIQYFPYCWTHPDYKQMQIDMMKPGYDYSSSRR